MNLNKRVWTGVALLLLGVSGTAQQKTISLDEAIQAGIANSKQLKLSQNKIDQAVSNWKQSKDEVLPQAKVSAGYSHALMLSRKFSLPSSDGQDPKSMEFPFDNTLYQATLSINQPVFAAHRYKYAVQSADLLVQSSRLDAEADKDEIVYNTIIAYINFYKIQQNQKIVAQNLEDVEQKLAEIKKFESQGLATRNDVLRYELERSNIQLQQIELANDRKVVNYNLCLMLGYPETSQLQVQDVTYQLGNTSDATAYLQTALRDRKEFVSLMYHDKLADIDIKKVHDEKLPEVGVGGNLYYINPSKAILPENGSFLAPFVVGVNVSWNISSLFKNKNRLEEANLQKQAIATNRQMIVDEVKKDVNEAYIQYQQALEKIKVLQDAEVQATENERIMESKFKNNLATTTDRIDAQSLLYTSRLNLELAKADATAAYYKLQKISGHIQP